MMYLTHPRNPLLFRNPKRRRSQSISALSMDSGLKMSEKSKDFLLCSEETKERISEMMSKVKLSVSSYDTAWVAMVPCENSHQVPYFPECVSWLLENQLPNGSWGLCHPLLVKDALLSTLACILALERWDIGQEHVDKGLKFIKSYFPSVTDDKQHSPVGFDIIFPGMIQYAHEMGINLHLEPTAFDTILLKRDMEFKRISSSNSEGKNLYLAYVAEGLHNSQNWKDIMKYQRKNGSLFNSPSTTAAAAIHLQDSSCLNYLRSILEIYRNAVPTAFPLDIYTQLSFVHNLESFGIARYFRNEIQSALHKIYNRWMMKDEEIFLDVATCAMAFRILRVHGYDVSSDDLAQFGEESFSKTLEGYLNDTGAVLELYRASHFAFPGELFLEKQKIWAWHFLKQELSDGPMHADRFYECISREVDLALRYPYYANLQRLENRRAIEHCSVNNLRILKTSYKPTELDNKDILRFAVEDFNFCQSIHQKELKYIERWHKENRLDKLTFARQKQTFCYFAGAATIFPPELSDARLSWVKNSILATVFDDLYDGEGGTREEKLNLLEILEKWDGVSADDICSEKVDILFNALRNTINELGENAFKWQQQNVTSHMIEIWLDLITASMQEAEWAEKKTVPTLDEYDAVANVSFTLGTIVHLALYFVEPHLSKEVIRSRECLELLRLVSRCGRYINDIQCFERERKEEGKLNSVPLLMIHDSAVSTEEEAVSKLRNVIDNNRRQLMKLVMQTNGSIVPRPCKDLFWNMCRVVHFFYAASDGFTSDELVVSDVKAVLFVPLSPPDE